MSDDLIRQLAQLRREFKALQTRDAGFVTGTFTPTLVGSGVAGTFTYAGTGAHYTRIGNCVSISGRVNITATTVAPTGNMSINGLPFTPVATASVIAGGVTFIVWSNINVAAGYTYVGGSILDGSAVVNLVRSGDAVAAALVQGGEIGAAIDLQFFGHYLVA